MEVAYSVLLCVLLYFELITGTLVREITSQHVREYDGTYENEKSLGISCEGSSMQCSIKCLNDNRCVSIFYYTIAKTCILHADPFTYTKRSKSEIEAHGRCKADFFYYRQLDLCFKFGPIINASDSNVAKACSEPGEELIKIDSEERQQYIELITADIGLVYNRSICIQGTNMKNPSNKWTFNDGELMTYSKWGIRHPAVNGTFIRINRGENYTWTSIKNAKWCSYICEYNWNDTNASNKT
ncbi:Hypothetical predicted protein [Mytilus galloprovincialis]|uniref:C-type lectin domain-containing protein n=1 Tax=Mytilus galloprovincialis TaxID=29158 RepID=A0A8B6EW43_MYTGA|nr:Hypothetical predicted protein [Mytilus galloprovincialis]